MGKQNNENCRCSICNNEIREERQYAALKVGENFVILDAEEVAHLNEFMENRKRKEKQPDYPKIEPEEEKEPLLAYGVLIPQYDSKIKDWNEELKKYIDYYNNERISMKLKGMSPVQYRTHSQAS